MTSRLPYDQRPFILYRRRKVLVNTDPQRRCYNGAHFSYEHHWTAWEVLDRLETQDIASQKLKFWEDLNRYAVTHRGDSARCEYRIEQQSYDATNNTGAVSHE